MEFEFNNKTDLRDKKAFPCPVCGSWDEIVVFPDSLGDDYPQFSYDFTPKHNRTYQIVACRQCTHHYSSPRHLNIWKYYEDVNDESYLDNEEQYIATFRGIIQKIQKYKHSGRLLDVGCATGIFLTVAKEFYRVEGLELSHWAGEISKKKGFAIHQKLLDEMQGNNLYDIISLWGVIEHMEFPTKEIANMYRLLKKNGIVCLWTGDVTSLPVWLLRKKWWYFQGQHIQYFSKRSLLKAFVDNGFKKLEISRYPYVMTMKSIKKSLERYPLLHNVTRPLSSKLLADIRITIRLPGEMFAFFIKE